MNFSQPGSGRLLAQQHGTSTVPTPLQAAKTFLSTLHPTTTMNEYRTHLTHLGLATHLILSDPRPNADPVRRWITTQPALFDTVLATMAILRDHTAGRARTNRIELYSAIKTTTVMMLEEVNKATDPGSNQPKRLPRGSEEAVYQLANLVGDTAIAPYHDTYLSDIARYWRTWGGTAEARKYEDVWSFVAGKVLVQD
ncbi:hypothetical protein N7G274_001866 [Stereocaulon virgatum]|uniref:Uncharacterized protein n=1 Tax=Stereocaulon virgatum TaxID=373712 RepID=A0ABR4ALM4_9LECA